MDSIVVSTMSRAPRIIERGTAHAAMIFTDLLRKEQYELKRAASSSSISSSSLGGASPRSPRSPRSAWTRTSPRPESHLRFGQESRVGQNGKSDSTVAWSTTPIQLSDSDGSEVCSPSNSFTISSEVPRAARSELARQMEHSKELQAALEEMEQLQDRISLLKTMARAAPQDIDSGSVVAPDRLSCAAPCRMRLVTAAVMATAPSMATATKASHVGVSGPDVDDDVARMPPDLGPRRRSSRNTVSMAPTACSEVALDAGTTSRARDAFSLIYEETIDAVFKADSWAAGLAKLRPYLDANMSKESADAFQECCGKLFVLSRVHTSMAPEVSFAKVQEITDALSRECSMASHTAAPLVAGLKRFVEQRILPNGALDHITEQGFRLPADEVGALLDRYRWPHDAKRTQVLHILRKTLEAVAELRTTSDAAVRGSESIEEARLILNHSHERLVRTMESVLDEHATRADPTLVLGQNLFVAVSRVAQAQEQENVHRLQSRSWPPLHSRVQTVFAEAEARAKAAVKAEAKAKAKMAEEVAMATAKAAAAAAAAAAAETAKQAAKEAAEEANRERLERYKAHEQVPPICPSRLPHSPILTSSPRNLTPISHPLHAQAEAAAAKEADMERKERAEHSRMQRAKAPEHPIFCAPCGNACAKDELPSAHSSCASVPDAGGPAVIAAAAPAPTLESPVAIESALEPLAGPPAPLPWEIKRLRNAQASSPEAAGYRRAGKTSCAAKMSDLCLAPRR